MESLKNYIGGQWVAGEGDGITLYNSINGEVIATASTEGIDYALIFEYARSVGGPALRKMTFRERGVMLKKLALHLYGMKEVFYELSSATGATRADSWIDIEGGIGNLFAYASLRKQFPDLPYYIDGESIPLSKKGHFSGQHICVPKEGVALHINAYNFPIWGMLEKIAVNLLAGVPAIVKPATVTSFLTELMVKEIVKSGILPEGSLQLLCGSARGIISHVNNQDVVTFTGSAWVGRKLKSDPAVINNSVPFNLEADSLNASILGPDAKPGTPEFDIYVKEVHKEMTIKGGQKCTAIRRAIVHESLIDDVQKALSERLAKTVIGDPSIEGVRMGALAGAEQRDDVIEKVQQLALSQEIVYGDIHTFEITGGNKDKGAFLAPILFRNDDPFGKIDVHNVEAFGPVSTLLPYKTIEEAIAISRMGKGSLVASIVTNNDETAREFVLGSAAYHGRILVLNNENARESTGHGSPLPMLTHGGPGRAGGGEEMGGKRGVLHYMQRTAVQGTPTTLTHVSGVYIPGGARPEAKKHLFKQHFEDLVVGETVYTHKRTVTEADIVNFANVSWDHFYAHTDVTSLEGTIFEQRVAHGYFILSAAAGLFVDPGKGPVLLNYGIEEARFTKPIYAGATIGVKLTVKEKMDQEKRDEEDIAKGIVKFYVEVCDETDEVVAVATILTMVKKRDQS